MTELLLKDKRLGGELLTDPAPTTNELWILVNSSNDLPRGAYEFTVRAEKSESSKAALYVDDLPQVYEGTTTNSPVSAVHWPMSFWGTLERPGDQDSIELEAT